MKKQHSFNLLIDIVIVCESSIIQLLNKQYLIPLLTCFKPRQTFLVTLSHTMAKEHEQFKSDRLICVNFVRKAVEAQNQESRVLIPDLFHPLHRIPFYIP